MKKYIWLVLAIFIIAIPTGNIIKFLVSNTFNSNEQISEILYPKRGWPKNEKSQLKIWDFLYQDTTNRIANKNNKMVSDFNNFYLGEFYKYHDIGKIPAADITNYIKNKITLSYDMQIYQALSLRAYFIEFNINKIKDASKNYINANEYLSLWTMKYFHAGFYYQWVKTWIPELGRTIEQAIDIDFYVFDSLVQTDENGNQQWSKGPKDNQMLPLPLLKLKPIMNNMVDNLSAKVLTNNQGERKSDTFRKY